jgi:hypothetical protein
VVRSPLYAAANPPREYGVTLTPYDMFVQQTPSNVMAISSMITFFCNNLDQCKNLETAKMDVLGKEIDYVNLRSEIYVFFLDFQLY